MITDVSLSVNFDFRQIKIERTRGCKRFQISNFLFVLKSFIQTVKRVSYSGIVIKFMDCLDPSNQIADSSGQEIKWVGSDRVKLPITSDGYKIRVRYVRPIRSINK
jgi:hypothetical protein